MVLLYKFVCVEAAFIIKCRRMINQTNQNIETDGNRYVLNVFICTCRIHSDCLHQSIFINRNAALHKIVCFMLCVDGALYNAHIKATRRVQLFSILYFSTTTKFVYIKLIKIMVLYTYICLYSIIYIHIESLYETHFRWNLKTISKAGKNILHFL